MSKILISLADQELQREIAGALRMKKHVIAPMEPPLSRDNPKKAAAELIAAKGDVAVVDYVGDDAFSVKMLQAATDQGPTPRFIFILPEEETPVSHILMAVNEGASAIMERPVNMEALANYVERAVSGPARFRYDLDREQTQVQEIAAIEREVKTMRTHLASYRKLIAYLMSTPLSSQHRNAMIVSDSAYQRDYLKKLLEDHGFSVVEASNPEEGLSVALEHHPRVVISDLEMEGKNGVEFCHDLKIAHKFMPCHFVICTANSEKVDEVMAPGNGIDGCVIKPSSESGNQHLIANVAMGLLL